MGDVMGEANRRANLAAAEKMKPGPYRTAMMAVCSTDERRITLGRILIEAESSLHFFSDPLAAPMDESVEDCESELSDVVDALQTLVDHLAAKLDELAEEADD